MDITVSYSAISQGFEEVPLTARKIRDFLRKEYSTKDIEASVDFRANIITIHCDEFSAADIDEITSAVQGFDSTNLKNQREMLRARKRINRYRDRLESAGIQVNLGTETEPDIFEAETRLTDLQVWQVVRNNARFAAAVPEAYSFESVQADDSRRILTGAECITIANAVEYHISVQRYTANTLKTGLVGADTATLKAFDVRSAWPQ